jgi:transcriptional regulator with XRE-family HTH domain
MTYAELLRTTRERHALSQRRLARRAGTTQAVVSRIEAGQVAPSVETLERLFAAMGWELDLAPRRSHWQDHDPAALRAFGELTPQARVEGLARTATALTELQGAARRAGA